MRLEPLRDRIGLPVLVINDSPIKQFAENEHAVGQSVLESFLRLTNLSTNGKRVTVFGYGACGRGVAANFRNAHAIVSVVERDPVKRLQAMLDGFLVPERDEALRTADVVVTVTGARGCRDRGRRAAAAAGRDARERRPLPVGDRRRRARGCRARPCSKAATW